MAKVPLPDSATTSEKTEKSSPVAPVRRRRFWPKLLLLLISAILVLPSIVGLFGFLPEILRSVNPQLAKTVQFRTVSLHWWAPVEIRGVVVRDLSTESPAEAAPLAEAESLKTREPLWKIVAQGGSGFTVVANEPHVNIRILDDTSNLETTLNEVFPTDSTSKDSAFPVRIEIIRGTINIQTPVVSSTTTSIKNLYGVWSSLDSTASYPELQVTARIENPRPESLSKSSSSRLAANLDQLTADFPVVPLEGFTLPGPSDASAADPGTEGVEPNFELRLAPSSDETPATQLVLRARELDLSPLQPMLRSFIPETSSSGIISCDIEAQLAGSTPAAGAVARFLLQGQQLKVRSARWAEDEWLELGTTYASGAMALASDGILLNDIKLSSDVASLQGSGELRIDSPESQDTHTAQLSGSLDIARLSTMLKRTLALHDDVQIQSGRILFSAKAAKESAADAQAADLLWQIAVQNERIEALRGGQPVVWDSILRIDAAGPWNQGRTSLSHARLTADFGRVDIAPAKQGFQLTGSAEPNKLWQSLGMLFQLPPIGVHGNVQFKAIAVPTTNSLLLSDVQVVSNDLQAASSGLEIHYHRPVTSMFDGQLKVQGSGAAMKTLVSPWHTANWLADRSSVDLDLQAEAERQVRVRFVVQPGPAAQAASHRVRSVSSSTISFASPKLMIDEGIAEFELTTDSLSGPFRIERGTVRIPGLAGAIAGTIQPFGQDVELNLAADVQYDLEILSRRVLASDSPIKLFGRSRDQFQVTGSPTWLGTTGPERSIIPVSSSGKSGLSPLRVDGGISWESGLLWGLTLGPGSVQANLEKGILRTQPIQCSVNSGTLSIMPQIDLAAGHIQLGTGSRIENVDLTPELCRDWLAYLAPMFADAAEVEGKFSARVNEFDYNTVAPEQSHISGSLTIHSAQASPGPSLTQMLSAIDLIRRIDKSDRSSVVRSITMPQQQIPFEFRQGYVVHQGLTLDLAGYRMKSSGAVGLNRQLQLVIDVPLEKTVGDTTGRSLQIPLRGTIDQPQPDTTGLLQNFGTQKIDQKINNELDRQLNKLLDKL